VPSYGGSRESLLRPGEAGVFYRKCIKERGHSEFHEIKRPLQPCRGAWRGASLSGLSGLFAFSGFFGFAQHEQQDRPNKQDKLD
jgi:hypothetical protein